MDQARPAERLTSRDTGDPASARLDPGSDSESPVGLLDRHGVAYVLVGGLAAVAHGATRATFDIEYVQRWEAHNLDAQAGALRVANARLRVPGTGDRGQPLASRGTDTVRILRR